MPKAFVFGDNIDTDVIAPGGYLHLGIDQVKMHSMEAIFPDFWKSVSKGDILVAGKNFGSGSSREQAPVVLIELGISLVVAKSFARLFFRNAVNVGLPIGVINDLTDISQGDPIEYNLARGEIRNQRSGSLTRFTPPQGALADILNEGGIVPYTLKKLSRSK
ncbi:MAG: 3-isopropylmalate dehydratase [Candidatus Thermoplasmatota archaeon]|nr:3-isopropylmalate dehydratase [Candidatus Thermoplasmatota archaeon]